MLADPVPDFPVFNLATKEVTANEPIVMIGYGPGETYGTFGHRTRVRTPWGIWRPLESGSLSNSNKALSFWRMEAPLRTF